MNWFRLYVEARNDAKLRSLTDSEHRVWFHLLCFAAEQPKRGVIARDIGVTDVTSRDWRDMADLLAVECANNNADLLITTVEKLVRLRILAADETGLTFIHFDERQYIKPSDTPEETRRRKAEQRERERAAKLAANNGGHAVSRGVTPGHATDTESDTEKEDSPQPPKGEGERPKLESIDGGKKPPSAHERRFDIFWEAYPNKTGKAVCRKWWDRRKPDDDLLGVMVAAIDQQRRSDKWQRGYIPNPATWLNQERWDDEPEAPPAAPDKPLPYNHPRNTRKFVG